MGAWRGPLCCAREQGGGRKCRSTAGLSGAQPAAVPLACLQVADGFKEVAQAVLAAHDSGELATALQSGHDGYKVGGGQVGLLPEGPGL